MKSKQEIMHSAIVDFRTYDLWLEEHALNLEYRHRGYVRAVLAYFEVME